MQNLTTVPSESTKLPCIPKNPSCGATGIITACLKSDSMRVTYDLFLGALGSSVQLKAKVSKEFSSVARLSPDL